MIHVGSTGQFRKGNGGRSLWVKSVSEIVSLFYEGMTHRLHQKEGPS